MNRMTEGWQSLTTLQAWSRATGPSQMQQIPRGRHQHTGVQAGPGRTQDHLRGKGGRKDKDRNHNREGQTTRETTKPAQAQRGAQKLRETASPQEHKDSTITRAPQGNTYKEAHDRQGGGGQHRQSNWEAQCAGPEGGTIRWGQKIGGACSRTKQETQNELRSAWNSSSKVKLSPRAFLSVNLTACKTWSAASLCNPSNTRSGQKETSYGAWVLPSASPKNHGAILLAQLAGNLANKVVVPLTKSTPVWRREWGWFVTTTLTGPLKARFRFTSALSLAATMSSERIGRNQKVAYSRHSFFPSNALWLPPGRSTCFQACCKWD